MREGKEELTEVNQFAQERQQGSGYMGCINDGGNTDPILLCVTEFVFGGGGILSQQRNIGVPTRKRKLLP